MKRLFNILIIFSVYILLCGKSCEDDSEQAKWQEKEIISVKDSIRDEFETDYLTEEARYAAEVKAIEKLKDLSDYVKIYTDVSMDSLFREKAGQMIRDIFKSEDVRLSFGQARNKKMKEMNLGEFLEKGFGNNISGAAVIFDSIRVLEPLQKSSEEKYSGKLAAFQTIILYSAADSILSSTKAITIHFISSKQTKIIGKDTLRVWEVALGGLE